MCKTCVSLFGSLVPAQTIGFMRFFACFLRQNAILSPARLPIPPLGHRFAERTRFSGARSNRASALMQGCRYFLSSFANVFAVALP